MADTAVSSEVGPLKEEIMRATYQALVEHGYSDLTMQAISDEFEKSKSLLYYHYDGKADLLSAFLAYALNTFLEEIEVESTDPQTQLETLIDRLVPETIDTETYQAQIALLELRSDAPHHPLYKEQYTTVDKTLQEKISEILFTGVETGVFTDIDPEVEAELLLSILHGIRMRRVTTHGSFPIEASRDAIYAHLDRFTAANDGEQ